MSQNEPPQPIALQRSSAGAEYVPAASMSSRMVSDVDADEWDQLVGVLDDFTVAETTAVLPALSVAGATLARCCRVVKRDFDPPDAAD